jgi:hypothetical protein
MATDLFQANLDFQALTHANNRQLRKSGYHFSDTLGQQLAEHVRRGVRITSRGKKLRDVGDLVTGSQQGLFRFVSGASLAKANIGDQPIAEAFAAFRVGESSSLA